jgi:hypothetical protein
LGRVDGRIRSFRKERGWTPTGEQQIENRMQDQLVTSTCRRCRASIRHHRRRVTLTAVPLRRSYTGNLSGMTVAAWTLALPSCPGAHAVPLSTWHYGGPTRSTPLRGRDKSPAVVMPIEAFNRGATKACADHRNSVRTMPINKSRRSGRAPGLALRNRSASYIGGAAAPGSRDHSAPALVCGASAATMARSRCVWIRCAKPIIRQELAIERRAFGPRRGSTKVEQRFPVGRLEDRRAEFGGRPDPLGAVEIRAGISASNAQPSGMGWGGVPGYAIGVVGKNDLLRQSRKRRGRWRKASGLAEAQATLRSR